MAKSKKKSVKPLGAFVLVKRNEAESTTQGGIIIPDSSVSYTHLTLPTIYSV